MESYCSYNSYLHPNRRSARPRLRVGRRALALYISREIEAPARQWQDRRYTYSDMAELDDLRAQAEAGDDKAQFTLGVGFDNGRGVKKDEAEAVILEPRLLGK